MSFLPTNYDKRMVGYMLEHPAVEEAAHALSLLYGAFSLRLHIIDAGDHAILAQLSEASAGDVLWYTHDEQHAGIIKQDGTIHPEYERP